MIENLTTQVDFMKFSNHAQILAICSTMKKNRLKLLHVPPLAVFSNWPPLNRNMQKSRCLDFQSRWWVYGCRKCREESAIIQVAPLPACIESWSKLYYHIRNCVFVLANHKAFAVALPSALLLWLLCEINVWERLKFWLYFGLSWQLVAH